MIRKNMLFFIILLFPSALYSQLTLNKHMVGASAGFSFLGSTPQIGLNHEYSFNLKELGFNDPGILSVGAIFRYWNYSENFINVDWEYENLLFGAQSNYHFYMSDDKIDPWLGVVITYNFSSSEAKIKTTGFRASENSNDGVWAGATAGVRYWLNQNMALNLRIGFGSFSYGAIDFGFDYEFD